MLAVARDIKEHTGGKLHAIVATATGDHVDGFATKMAKDPATSFAASIPDYVVQAVDGKARRNSRLDRTGGVDEGKAAISPHSPACTRIALYSPACRYARDPALKKQLGFIGEDNIGNANAVKNLMAMGAGKKGIYVYAGAPRNSTRRSASRSMCSGHQRSSSGRA